MVAIQQAGMRCYPPDTFCSLLDMSRYLPCSLALKYDRCEAGDAQHWARALTRMGHQVGLISRKKMRIMTILLGLFGGLLAVAGVWSLFLNWLNLLGIFVPPIGAIIIVDQILIRHYADTDSAPLGTALPVARH
jgi:hypothetical protein